MAEKDRWANGLDLAANACTAAESAEFVRLAEVILKDHPERQLHVVRSALSAGIRSVEFYGSLFGPNIEESAVRVAASHGMFDSAQSADKAKVEEHLRTWAASLPAAEQTQLLNGLASTETGTHFALNNAFPALLAQDATTLPRLADELSERVPKHAHLPQVQAIVQQQRKARSEAAAKRIAAVTQLTGDKTAGGPLFTSLCLTCHSAGGKGIGFAPPLDGSNKRDLPALLQAMLEPDAAVENVFRPLHIRLRNGTELEGFLKARSGNRVTIQMMGGATQHVNLFRAHTARYRNGHSSMPPLAAGLADQQIADLGAFVRGL